VLEVTQLIDRMTVADTNTPAFKSAISGTVPRAYAISTGAPEPPAPVIIVSVAAKKVSPKADGGIEVVYAVTGLNTNPEGLCAIIGNAVRAGVFTQALKNAGYPNANAGQKITVTDETPTPNPKKYTVLDVTQVVSGVSIEDANAPAFKAALGDSVATAPAVSADLPAFDNEGDFNFQLPTFSPPSFTLPTFTLPGGADETPVPKVKRPMIIKVVTFSVAPIGGESGIVHGFLVTAQYATAAQVTDVVNSAIKAGYFTKAFRDAGFTNATASDPLDIADDMTPVYYPAGNPLERLVLYCQHRIYNLKQEETKTLAFKSSFGSVLPKAVDPDSDKDSKPIIIIECVMNSVIETPSGHGLVADYTVTALNCSMPQLKSIINNAVNAGVFTQALKDAGFNKANATEHVALTDATPKVNPKQFTVVNVTQVVLGVPLSEGKTPTFGTAMGTSVATAPSVSAPEEEKPKTPKRFVLFPGDDAAAPSGEQKDDGPFLPLPTMPNVVFPQVRLFGGPEDLYHLDPENRGQLSKQTTESSRPPSKSGAGSGGLAGLFGAADTDDNGLPKGSGQLKVEIVPRSKADPPGMIPGSDEPEDKYLGEENDAADDHAVTGHLLYDIYKALNI